MDIIKTDNSRAFWKKLIALMYLDAIICYHKVGRAGQESCQDRFRIKPEVMLLCEKKVIVGRENTGLRLFCK